MINPEDLVTVVTRDDVWKSHEVAKIKELLTPEVWEYENSKCKNALVLLGEYCKEEIQSIFDNIISGLRVCVDKSQSPKVLSGGNYD